ncbi:MFS transporter [Aquabacterium sp.]|uniref:MFS transporter n=1 Tax=Aquabacterium sp. TaxID=1872578 RepID=UPI003783CE33
MSPASSARLEWLPAGLRYGALGAPMAFAALPLYVLLPSHYANQLGAPLAGLGAVLLGARTLDAAIDPWLGRLADGILGRPRGHALAWATGAAVLLALGFCALFFPPALPTGSLLMWCALALLVTYLGYSGLTVLHQAWGARLGGDARQQSSLIGWREGLALVGVIVASALPSLAGMGAMVLACTIGLALGLAALARAPFAGGPATSATAAPRAVGSPWRQPDFRRLIGIFVVNGIASAVPATLVLFFIRDRLAAPGLDGLFLGAYFASAALSLPLWTRLVARIGLWRCWLAGMALAVCSFVWTATLGPGDTTAFLLVCLGSGMAVGVDLVAPAALLTAVIQRAGDARRGEGGYVGWWTCATKLNLALAAGLSLPALQALGYVPGVRTADSTAALMFCYAVVPCALKLLAAALLWQGRHHFESSTP